MNITSEKQLIDSVLPAGYINVGILFKIFESYIGTINLYRVFILFEASVYVLVSMMFYLILEKYLTDIKKKIIGIIFTIIYILGYVLNAWLSGFHYLLLGILFIEIILYLNTYKNELKFICKLIILFLLNFGLILSYPLFCPFVYLAEFIYYCYELKKDKEKLKLILLVIFTLIIPGIIGVSFLLLPMHSEYMDAITLDGWIYKNLWSNFILFIPFAIYLIIKNIKEREFAFDNLILILLLEYMIILFIGTKIGKCSEYYFYKNYFILWMLLIYTNIVGIIKFLEQEKERNIVYIYTIAYIIILLLSVGFKKIGITFEANDNINNTMEIFILNDTMATSREAGFVKKCDIEILKELEKNIDSKWINRDDILFIIDTTRESWIYSMTGYSNNLYLNIDLTIENLNKENYKYIVVIEDTPIYQYIKRHINTEEMNLLYENEIGKIYEKRR